MYSYSPCPSPIKGTKPKETFGGDRYIYYLHCGDGIMGAYIYMCPNSSNFIHYVQFFFVPNKAKVYKLYLNYLNKTILIVEYSIYCLFRKNKKQEEKEVEKEEVEEEKIFTIQGYYNKETECS